MTVDEIIADLRSKGINLWLEGNTLRYRTPKGALSADLKSHLSERRAEIIAYLEQGAAVSAFQPATVCRASRTDKLPFSFAEEGIWLLEQLRPGTTAWNMRSVLRISGALDVANLKRSLNALMERQEILRTAFPMIDGNLVRLISPELAIDLPVSDLDPLADGDEEIRRIAAEEHRRPFDLATPPLIRARLLRVDNREHVLILGMHHIISDGWSQQVFLRELFSLYEAFMAHRPPALAPLSIQYSDYALWLRQSEHAKVESELSYWKSRLDGVSVVELPGDKRKPELRSFRGSRQQIQLTSEHARSLKELGKQDRATLFMVLVAAFEVLLYRYTGKTDLVVGSTIAGRQRPELQNLLGFFINLLVLRSDLAGEPSFRDLLRRVREECLEAFERQNLPFEKLVEAINPSRGLQRNTFFQVLFNVFNLPPIQRQLDGLLVEPIALHGESVKFDLTIHALDTKDGVTIRVAYRTDLFSDAWISEFLEQYQQLLEQVVEDGDERIEEYSLVTVSASEILPDPRAPLDERWQGAIHDIFAGHAERQPDQIAVEDQHQAWSYQELNERSNQLAHYLRDNGIQTGETVAIVAHRSAALVWALLGVLKAGAAFCVIDPSHPASRVKQYLSATDPQALIQIDAGPPPDAALQEALNRDSLRCRITLPGRAGAGTLPSLSQYPIVNPDIAVGGDDLAYVAFTSGSTGGPKGVLGRQGPMTHSLPWLSRRFGLSATDRFSLLSGLSFNLLHREVFTALGLGATLCIADPEEIAAGRLAQWLNRQAISVAHLTPAMGKILTGADPISLRSLRYVFFGGDQLRKRDVELLWELAPEVTMVVFYGATETQRAVGHFVIAPKNDPIHQQQPLNDVMPLGRGIEDVQLLVLNRSQRLAGVGELGEIFVRSPHLAKGYLNDDPLTQQRFLINPFTLDPADRLYKTAEWGRYLPDGNVQWVGRRDRQVNIRGFRIEPGEIEAALCDHPAVRETVVLAREDTPGDQRLVAYLVLNQHRQATAHELRSSLKHQLPDFMIPSHFVFLDALPLTPNAKVDLLALPPPLRDRDEVKTVFLAPRSALEKALSQSWAEILDLERVGTEDNFFELGGHSLLAMQVIARIRHAFGVELPLRLLYEVPTVAALAAELLHVSGDPVRIEKTAAMLLRLAQISEDQVDRMLAEKTQASKIGNSR